MTKTDLMYIVSCLPERVLEDGSRHVEPTSADLTMMSSIVYELTLRLEALRNEWRRRNVARHDSDRSL